MHIGGGVWSGTWRPINPAARVLLTVTAANFEAAAAQKEQIVITGTMRDSSRSPIVTASGLLHGASLAEGQPIAPGTLITIKGLNLADDIGKPTGLPLPREINGVEVLLGDRTLPLLYVSKNQLNVQIPFNLPANTDHPILVRRGDQLSVPEPVTVTETMPGIFTTSESGTGQGVIERQATPGWPTLRRLLPWGYDPSVLYRAWCSQCACSGWRIPVGLSTRRLAGRSNDRRPKCTGCVCRFGPKSGGLVPSSCGGA